MEEGIGELLRLVYRVIVAGFRIVQLVAWEWLFHGIGWHLGWLFYRVVSFGRFPSARSRDEYQASLSTVLLVELTGLTLLGILIAAFNLLISKSPA